MLITKNKTKNADSTFLQFIKYSAEKNDPIAKHKSKIKIQRKIYIYLNPIPTFKP